MLTLRLAKAITISPKIGARMLNTRRCLSAPMEVSGLLKDARLHGCPPPCRDARRSDQALRLLSISRRTRCRILPVAVLGMSESLIKVTAREPLYTAILSRHQ